MCECVTPPNPVSLQIFPSIPPAVLPHPTPPSSSPPLHPSPCLFRCIWINIIFELVICVYVWGFFYGVCGALPHGSVRVGGHERVRRDDENQQLLGKFILSALITCSVIPRAPFTLCPSPFNPYSPSLLHLPSFYLGVHE